MIKQNIVLIIIDALRADNIGCYGYTRKTSPNIDKLAREGILFENAFSCTNTTDPSITTILSGKYPISHGIRNHGPKVTNSMVQEFYKRKIRLLSEILRSSGYLTFGIDWIGKWHKKGFEYYFGNTMQKKHSMLSMLFSRITNKFPEAFLNKIKDVIFTKKIKNNDLPYYTAARLTDTSLKLISNCGKPFFLFIHYWDTHTPYTSPENIYTEFKPEKRKNSRELKELLANISNKKWKGYLLKTFGERRTAEEVIAMYDSAIRYVDQEIGRLIDSLKDKGIYDDTIFVITSDHGESLTEHGIFFDHHGLYDVSIHVPLIFNNIPDTKVPGTKRKRVRDFVQHVDIVPTLLDILDIPFNRSEFDGISLIPVMKGKKSVSRPFIVAEESYTEIKMAIRTKEWKYIYSPSKEAAICRYCGVIHGGVEELYHLDNDPNELQNIVEEKPEISRDLRKMLFSWLNNLKSKEEKIQISKKIRKLKMNRKI